MLISPGLRHHFTTTRRQEQWNAFQKLAQMLMHTPFNAEGIVTKIFTDANGTQHIGLHPIPDRSGLWRYLSTTLLLLTMLGSDIYNGVQAWRRYQRHRTRMMKIQAYYESCLNPQLIHPFRKPYRITRLRGRLCYPVAQIASLWRFPSCISTLPGRT